MREVFNKLKKVHRFSTGIVAGIYNLIVGGNGYGAVRKRIIFI